jgi:hypothetical protein
LRAACLTGRVFLRETSDEARRTGCIVDGH